MMVLIGTGDVKPRIAQLSIILDKFEKKVPGKIAHTWMQAVSILHSRFNNGIIGRLDVFRMNLVHMKIGEEYGKIRSKLTGATDIKFTNYTPAFLMLIGDVFDTMEEKNPVKAPFRDGFECRCLEKCNNLCKKQQESLEGLFNGRTTLSRAFTISRFVQVNTESGAITAYSWSVLCTCAEGQRSKEFMVLHYDTASNSFELRGCSNKYSIKLEDWKKRGDLLGHIFNENSNSSAVIIKLWLVLHAKLVPQFVIPDQAIETISNLKLVIGDICEWYQFDHSPKILELPSLYWSPQLNFKQLHMQGSLVNIILSLKKGLVVRNGRLVPMPYLPDEIIGMILCFLPISELAKYGKQRLRW